MAQIRRILGNEGLSSDLAVLRAQIGESQAPGDGRNFSPPVFASADQSQTFPLTDWWKPSFWEPTVALAIRDYCRPADVVFDVGTNAGADIAPRWAAACRNVTLFHKAVWHQSGDLVNMAPGDHLNDRIQEGFRGGMTVRTIALDDIAFAGDFVDGEVVFRYHTFTAFMADSYRDWVIHLDWPGEIGPYLGSIVGSDDTLQWDGVDVFPLPDFDGFSRGIIE
jgi:hypothetical protein